MAKTLALPMAAESNLNVDQPKLNAPANYL